jgi:hypothetical protein
MKKNYIKCVLGIVFCLLGIVLLCLTISYWSVSIKTIPSFPLIFGAEILFVIIGLTVLITGIIENKKINKYNVAKNNNATEEELFVLEENVKQLRKKMVFVMCFPIPFILLLAFMYALIQAFNMENKPILGIIIIFIGLAFLSFVCIGILTCLIQYLHKNTKKQYVKGELKKIVLANNVKIENGDVLIEQYRLLITYTLNDKKCEILTQETFSKDQISLIKKYVYIPLIIKDDNIKVNQDQLLKTSKNITQMTNVSEEKGSVAMFGNTKKNQTKALQDIRKITESIDTVKQRIKKEKQLNIVFVIFALLFFTVFDGLAIFAVINDSSFLIILFAVLCGIFTIFMLFLIVVKPIINNYIYKQTMKFGYDTFAENYELVTKSDSNNHSFRYMYSLKFEYLDDNCNKRKGVESNIKVSHFFFTSYTVDKLPIKVWKKHAVIDYDELLKYQNENKK